jgi:hypothetical protein
MFELLAELIDLRSMVWPRIMSGGAFIIEYSASRRQKWPN